MAENETASARPKVVTVSLTEEHVDTLDRIARDENRSRSAQLRTLIDEEASRRAAALSTPTAA